MCAVLAPVISYNQARFPDLQGVGSGAILSNYQRTRVENVCGRLGLTSLAYLWRRPQSSLLSEMVAAGVDAVLVKVMMRFAVPKCSRLETSSVVRMSKTSVKLKAEESSTLRYQRTNRER